MVLTSAFYLGEGNLFLTPEFQNPRYFGDEITIDTNATGGVYANLNGEVVSYPNGQVTHVWISPGYGPNQVDAFSFLDPPFPSPNE